MIERYEHHGTEVAVQSHLKGQHRAHCLCYQGCVHFMPGADGNCEVAEANLANCKKFGTVQPVWECPRFEAEAPEVDPHPGQIVGPRLVGLAGLAGSGKSTAAAILEQNGYTRLRFAGPLKAALRALLISAAVPADVADRMIEGDLKEVPQAVLGGKTPRHAMQTLGTEWGRDHIGAGFWVGLAVARAHLILARGGRVVIDDVRFANEVEAIRAAGAAAGIEAELWALQGRGGRAGAHVSEADPVQFDPDAILDNSRSQEYLEAQVLELILG